ncbi:uncharacterized protein DDB_G0282077-like [Macrobrachium rosenbergii]|uniref:uncharacterized protein DDB_G0282077-like n=1 Tax=Macrobrachium rosenbergii TaxID=79674 RepID=UPI0034D552D6
MALQLLGSLPPFFIFFRFLQGLSISVLGGNEGTDSGERPEGLAGTRSGVASEATEGLLTLAAATTGARAVSTSLSGEASSWSPRGVADWSTRGSSSGDGFGEEDVSGTRGSQVAMISAVRGPGSPGGGSASSSGSGTGSSLSSGSTSEMEKHSTAQCLQVALTAIKGQARLMRGLEVQYLADGLSWAETEILAPAGGQRLLESLGQEHPLGVAYLGSPPN